ncbi:MAG TPA: hypothetical protein ENL12_03260 [Dehalococcoidia bacterium]|nr:hypothetical protein [Dehalococcoidia bacterium]
MFHASYLSETTTFDGCRPVATISVIDITIITFRREVLPSTVSPLGILLLACATRNGGDKTGQDTRNDSGNYLSINRIMSYGTITTAAIATDAKAVATYLSMRHIHLLIPVLPVETLSAQEDTQ